MSTMPPASEQVLKLIFKLFFFSLRARPKIYECVNTFGALAILSQENSLDRTVRRRPLSLTVVLRLQVNNEKLFHGCSVLIYLIDSGHTRGTFRTLKKGIFCTFSSGCPLIELSFELYTPYLQGVPMHSKYVVIY